MRFAQLMRKRNEFRGTFGHDTFSNSHSNNNDENKWANLIDICRIIRIFVD